MPVVETTKHTLGFIIRKKLGRRYAFGRSMFGESLFGDYGLFAWLAMFGDAIFAHSYYGDSDELSGIYQLKTRWPGNPVSRQEFYISKNPRTIPQQANRSKLADAVAAWQVLTPPQKAVYNKRAKNLKMYGDNLFIKEYMLS